MSATARTAPLKARDRTPVVNAQHSLNDLYAAGKALRDKCPRSAHAGWEAPHARRDPVELVLEAEKGRMPELLPLRHGRMVRSAFTFYRGSALTMAADLASTPTTGVRVQCCGDAHLCNFGHPRSIGPGQCSNTRQVKGHGIKRGQMSMDKLICTCSCTTSLPEHL